MSTPPLKKNISIFMWNLRFFDFIKFGMLDGVQSLVYGILYIFRHSPYNNITRKNESNEDIDVLWGGKADRLHDKDVVLL